MEKVDRRILYTKKVIRENFIRFLKQKPIAKITVKEICAAADINRSTFYTHYTDQYDLLRQIEDEVIHDVTQYLQAHDFKDMEHIPTDIVEHILGYIRSNAELFDLLLNSHSNQKFQQEVIKLIGIEHFIPILTSDTMCEDNAAYIFHFMATGAVGVIQLWLKGGMVKPEREVAELILSASLYGREAFVRQM